MDSKIILYAMAAHVFWVAFLYVVLTIMRAPDAWGVGRRNDGSNPFSKLEPKVSANLSNQFEWPIIFYIGCILTLQMGGPIQTSAAVFAWVFVAGRVMHSIVQIGLSNIRLRGAIFTINFLAVLALWAQIIVSSYLEIH